MRSLANHPADRSPPAAQTAHAPLGELLRQHRERLGLSQEELAARVEPALSPNTISNLERGRTRPHRHTLLALCTALGLDEADRRQAEAAWRREPSPALSNGSADVMPGPAGVRHARLPTFLAPLIGREQDVEAIAARLRPGGARLLTLVGPGGVGKTRLALAVAERLRQAYADDVWLVELAPLTEPRLVARMVAGAFGLLDAAESEPLVYRLLGSALGSRQLLLVLDNCEHLIDACAELASSLLGQLPGVSILATSREALDIPGELVWRVPPLHVPAPDRVVSPADLATCAAVQLFVERARAVETGFELRADNVHPIAEICARLDGLPLALELAASRVRVLGLEQIRERLDDSFGLLASTSRGLPARQQTLRATLDWSHQSLTAPEQAVFRRLAVFAGGCELEAAEAVCGDQDVPRAEVLPTLGRLLDKSLLIKDDLSGRAWYRFLEPIRQFAREQLQASGELDAARCRHAETYLALAETAEPELVRSEQTAWLDRLERNLGNLRAVLEWSRERSERTELGLRLSGALWRFWDTRGHIGEGRRWLSDLLKQPRAGSPTAGRGKALFAATMLGGMQESADAVASLATESLAIWRELDDQHGYGWAVWLDGWLHRHQNPGLALERGEQALGLAREGGDELLRAWATWLVGEARRLQGELLAATPLLEEARTLAIDGGDLAGVGFILRSLAQLAMRQGDYARAAALLRERLLFSHRVGDRWNVPDTVEGLAWIANQAGHATRATRLYAAADALRQATGAMLLGDRRARRARRVHALREVLGETAMDRAWAEGRALSLEQTIALGLADDAPDAPGPGAQAAPARSARD